MTASAQLELVHARDARAPIARGAGVRRAGVRAGVRDESGVALVGLMIAVVLLSVGVVALMTSAVAAFSLQTEAATRTTALEIASSYMETVKSRKPTAIVSESPVQVTEDGTPSETGMFERSVKVEPAGKDLKNVKVLVDFPRAPRPLELVTLVYDPS